MSARSVSRWVGCAAVCAALTLPAGGAYAQAGAKAAAEALFESGRQLSESGQNAEACRKFEASHKIDPALGTMLHLADCYERDGRTASAWAMFREAASVAQSSGQTQRREVAETRAAALAPRLARVEVQVEPSARVEGLRIELGGVPVPPASWGAAIPVDPGTLPVRASAPGHRDWSSPVTVGDGGVATLTVPALLPAPHAPDPSAARVSAGALDAGGGRDAAPSSRGGTQRGVGIVVGAIGLGGLAAGGILGTQAMNQNDESLRECRDDDPTLCNADGVNKRRDAEAFALGSTIAFAAGGGLLLTGIVLYATAPSRRATSTRVELRPMTSSRLRGLMVGGAF